MKGKKEMEIRKPKFKVGDKVITKKCHVGNVIKVDSYHFVEDEYWYDVSCDEVDAGFYTESYLEPYVDKPKNVWDLKNDDTYYLIDIDGDVMNATWNNIDIDIDSNFRKIGNVFLTKEEAENDVERRKVETEMLHLGGRREFKNGENNYYIVCDFDSSHFAIRVFNNKSDGFAPMTIYFDSAKECRNAIEKIGEDRIKKYIFKLGISCNEN